MTELRQSRQQLGAQLRQIRLENGLTLEQLAGKLQFFGGKGTFSEYENAKRVAPVAVLQAYATQFGVDDKALLQLRANALARPPVDARPEAPRGDSPADVTARSWPRRRWRPLAAAGCLVVLIALVVTWRVNATPTLSGTISQPRVSAPAVGPVRGSVHGLQPGDQLWLASQVHGERAWNPTEMPCAVTAHSWLFPTLYLGRPEDAGRPFRIVLFATKPGTAAQQALIDYAHRPKGTADYYAGIAALPTQAKVLAESDVVRD